MGEPSGSKKWFVEKKRSTLKWFLNGMSMIILRRN
jgi:hypothetical protein